MACIIIVTEKKSTQFCDHKKRLFSSSNQHSLQKDQPCPDYGSPKMSTPCKSGKMKQIMPSVKMITTHTVIQEVSYVSVTKSIST